MDVNQIRFIKAVTLNIARNIEQYRHLGFSVRSSGELMWRNRRVVLLEDLDKVLTAEYLGIGANIGRDRFYQRIRDKYVGISRRQVMRFLKSQETYQLHQPIPPKRIIQPIVTSRVRQRWQMDLIDMHQLASMNNGDSWVLTVIDLFSKRAWAFAVKNKESNGVAKCLQKLFSVEKPSVLQSDRGTEFTNAFVGSIVRRFGVKHVFTKAYTPQGQGAVERFNGTLKRMMYSHFTMFNTRKWNDVLDKLVQEYNVTPHSVTRQKPLVLHDLQAPTDVKRAQRAIQRQADKLLEDRVSRTKRLPVIENGDFVRISKLHCDVDGQGGLSTIAAEERACQVSGFAKSYLPNWSREVFQVKKVSPSKRNPQFVLMTLQGERLKQRFYREYLLLIPKRKVGVDNLGRDVYAPIVMKNVSPRPVYRDDIFNREEHLRRLHSTPLAVGRELEPRESLLEGRAPRHARSPFPYQDFAFYF